MIIILLKISYHQLSVYLQPMGRMWSDHAMYKYEKLHQTE